MNHHPDVHAYELEWGYPEPLSVHVVESGEATVLFGAGSRDTTDAVTELAVEHSVDVVVAEHGDPDHYAGIPGLRQKIDGIHVAVPEGDAHLLRDAGIDPDVELEPNRAYWGITTVPAPGHTPDNMAYLYRDVLIAGDTVVGSNSVFAADGDWSGAFAVCTPEYNHDDDLTRESVTDLLDHKYNAVLVSHGENVPENGYTEIQKLARDLE